MTTISARDWAAYIQKLASLNEKAAAEMKAYVLEHGYADMQALTDYAYALATKYGEGAAALAAAMYDATAELEGAILELAEPAETPLYQEVAKTVRGVAAQSQNSEMLGGAVGRLVKRTGADTTLQNADRDGTEFAWIPHGDTCPYCIALAARGWQRQGKAALKGGHAEHIHAHCDCTYAVRFRGESGVEGYDPAVYQKMLEDTGEPNSKSQIRALRREQYAEDADRINAQKREAYAARTKGNKE